MVTSIEISNFKCFSSLKLRLAPLTLLTGFNSAGKSTALQSLLLLAQNLQKYGPSTEQFALNGKFVRLGAVSDILPSDSKESRVSFVVSAKSETRAWYLEARPGERALQEQGSDAPILEREENAVDDGLVVRSLSELQYLSATRGGFSDGYPVPDLEVDSNRSVGIDGRFAPFQYEKLADDEVAVQRRHPEESASLLRKQVDAWMSHIFPRAQVNVQRFPQLGLLALQFQTSDFGDWRRPANVGYGFSYVFPVIVALLIARNGQTVIVDSPEAHLHPSAQSAMGRMLAHLSAAGVRVITETHSDHVLNGVRLAIKKRVIHASEVAVHFFSGVSGQSHGVFSPTIDAEGAMHEWPDGFFDQSEKDIVQIAGWA